MSYAMLTLTEPVCPDMGYSADLTQLRCRDCDVYACRCRCLTCWQSTAAQRIRLAPRLTALATLCHNLAIGAALVKAFSLGCINERLRGWDAEPLIGAGS